MSIVRVTGCRAVAAVLAAAAVALGAATSGARAEPVKLTAIADATYTRPWSWHTCKARAMMQNGATRFYNDQFQASPGESCITAHGDSLTIDDNAAPHDGTVVKAPAIQLGRYYGWTDPASGLPRPVRGLRDVTVNYGCAGHAPGVWTCDALDAWLSPSLATAGTHGNAEVVVTTRTWNGATTTGGPSYRIDGTWWKATMWTTCPAALAPLCWPLIRFIKVAQVAAVRPYRVAPFIRFARRHGWLPSSEWLDSVNPMAEVWSGSKGLTITAFMTGITPTPVITQLGASS